MSTTDDTANLAERERIVGIVRALGMEVVKGQLACALPGGSPRARLKAKAFHDGMNHAVRMILKEIAQPSPQGHSHDNSK